MNPPKNTVQVTHVVQGVPVFGTDVEYTSRIGESFVTPKLDLDALIVPRTEPGPAFDLPLSEILDFLEETGKRLDINTNPHLAEALDLIASSSPHSRRVVENTYRGMGQAFSKSALGYQVERELGHGVIDDWIPVYKPGVPVAHIRAFPPRLIHIIAGNGAPGSSMSIIRGALTKGINLLKLPSNDPFTATAILKTMADVDPNHPTVRSFSAAYWRGGDTEVESLLYRPQYFDKLIAWGGEATIRHALKYVGPGFELVQYDPKVSMSMIGKEAFKNDETLEQVANLAATDVNMMNQEGCNSSRYQFVEGSIEEVDRYCEALARQLAVDRFWGDGKIWKTPTDIRDTVEGFRYTGEHAVFGHYDGRGLVVRSSEMVDFHPIAKTVNVIPVSSLKEATRYASVATQTVGVYPRERRAELRNLLASQGAQRVVTLGGAIGLALSAHGLPHDGFMPLQRLMRWVSDEETE